MFQIPINVVYCYAKLYVKTFECIGAGENGQIQFVAHMKIEQDRYEVDFLSADVKNPLSERPDFYTYGSTPYQ